MSEEKKQHKKKVRQKIIIRRYIQRRHPDEDSLKSKNINGPNLTASGDGVSHRYVEHREGI